MQNCKLARFQNSTFAKLLGCKALGIQGSKAVRWQGFRMKIFQSSMVSLRNKVSWLQGCKLQGRKIERNLKLYH